MGQTQESESGFLPGQRVEQDLNDDQFASYTSQNSQADIARELLETCQSAGPEQYDADLESGSVALDGGIASDSSALFENSRSTNLERANANLLAHRTNSGSAANKSGGAADHSGGAAPQDAVWRPGLGALDEESDFLDDTDTLRDMYAQSAMSENSEFQTQLTSHNTSLSESGQLNNVFEYSHTAGHSSPLQGGRGTPLSPGGISEEGQEIFSDSLALSDDNTASMAPSLDIHAQLSPIPEASDELRGGGSSFTDKTPVARGRNNSWNNLTGSPSFQNNRYFPNPAGASSQGAAAPRLAQSMRAGVMEGSGSSSPAAAAAVPSHRSHGSHAHVPAPHPSAYSPNKHSPHSQQTQRMGPADPHPHPHHAKVPPRAQSPLARSTSGHSGHSGDSSNMLPDGRIQYAEEEETLMNASNAISAMHANPRDQGAALIASSAVAAAAAGAAAALLAEQTARQGSGGGGSLPSAHGSSPPHEGGLSNLSNRNSSSFLEGHSGGHKWSRGGCDALSGGSSPRSGRIGGAQSGPVSGQVSGALSGVSPSPPRSQSDPRSFMGMSGGSWTGPELFAAEDQVEVVMGTLFHTMDTDDGAGPASSANTLVATGTNCLLFSDFVQF